MLEETDTLPQPLIDEDVLDANATNQTLQSQTRHQRRRRGWLIVTTVVLAIGLIAGGGGLYWWLNRQPPVQYIQAPVITGDISVQVSATGPVTPNAQYSLNFATAGQISAINVKVGQQVTKGQVLATITPTDTSSNADNSNTTDTKLVAPGNATVEAINGAVGEQVSPTSTGSGNNQAFMVLVDTSQLKILAQVNEVDISNVRLEQATQFTISAYPTTTFNATVSNINTIGQTSSDIVTYTVTLTVDQASIPSNVHLYPGMTATTNITTQQRTETLLIPAAALSFPSVTLQDDEIDQTAFDPSLSTGPSTDDDPGQPHGTGGPQTMPPLAQSNQQPVLKLQDEELVPVMITIGLKSGQFVEVLSGLQDGDQVVIGQAGGNRGSKGDEEDGNSFSDGDYSRGVEKGSGI